MGKFAKATLFVLLLATPILANVASVPVPAVFSTNGAELVVLEVELRNGMGYVYFATNPLVGTQTQDSARTAFSVATGMTGVGNKYDALLRLRNTSGSNSVDGPSAGAAMTLMMLSLLENKTVRNDLTMTGTIESDGSVGEVGEVGAKTKAAADAGMHVMLIPLLAGISDKMIFITLGSRWNITIIEVGNISQVTDLAFTDTAVNLRSNVMEINPSSQVKVAASEINCPGCHIEEFKTLTDSMIKENRALVAEISGENRSDFSYFLKTLEADMNESENAEEWGYPYTSANEAFLTSINLNFLKGSNVTYDSFRNSMLDVDNCVNDVERPIVTKENFELVAGGDERLAWSRKKLYEIFNQNYSSDDIETILSLYRELINAQMWCNVSHQMYSIANNISGTPVDESRLKQFAADKMAETENTLKSFGGAQFGDAEWRFEATKDEFNKSEFMAAVFDSDYLMATMESANRSQDMNGFALNEFGTPRTWNGMWAALYNNHAKYVYLKSEATKQSAVASVMLADYAHWLDNDTVQMRELFQAPANETRGGAASTSNPSPVDNENELAILLVFCVIVAIFLNLVQFFKGE